MTRKVLPLALFLLLASCTGRYVRAVQAGDFPRTPERLERGRYLVDQVSACGTCHTSRAGDDILTETEESSSYLGGGNIERASGLAVWVPNLTSDPETGLGRWSDDEILRALRDGVRPDGRFLVPLMPCDAFRRLSDDDARAIVAYLRTVPIVHQTRPREPVRLGLLFHLLFETFGVQLHPPAVGVSAPSQRDPIAYGGYLATVGLCASCHSMGSRGPRHPGDALYLGGSDKPFESAALGKVWASNLTPDVETGLGRYGAAQILAALREGRRLDGKRLAPPMSGIVAHATGMTDADLAALVAYLQSVPPVRRAVPARQLAPALARELGGG
ncbi:MAG: c-type cytochrome [Deltaproteobacteria bacterium]